MGVQYADTREALHPWSLLHYAAKVTNFVFTAGIACQAMLK